MSVLELQEKFVLGVARDLPSKWDSMQVHYEHLLIDGVPFERFTSVYLEGSSRRQFDLSLDCADVLLELNRVVTEGQAEHWTFVDVSVERSGKYKFDYGYRMHPLAAEFLRRTAQPG